MFVTMQSFKELPCKVRQSSPNRADLCVWNEYSQEPAIIRRDAPPEGVNCVIGYKMDRIVK